MDSFNLYNNSIQKFRERIEFEMRWWLRMTRHFFPGQSRTREEETRQAEEQSRRRTSDQQRVDEGRKATGLH